MKARTWGTVVSTLVCSTRLWASVYYGVNGPEVSAIMRSNLDGSGVPQVVYLTSAVGGLALVGQADHVYWSSGGTVLRGNLDGSGVPVEVAAANGTISGIGADWEGGTIYYGVNGPEASAIMRANLDGSGVPQVVYLTSAVRGLAIVGQAGQVYWSSGSTVLRGNLDGSGVPVEVTGANGVVSGLGVDWEGGKVYYGVNGPEVSTIRRANLDGSGAPQVVYATPSIRDLVLDGATGTIYWSSGSSVLRGNLDGSGVPVAVTGANGAVSGLGISSCAGDVDGDGVADLDDLVVVLANFGLSPATRGDGDLSGNAIVDLDDLLIVMGELGCH